MIFHRARIKLPDADYPIIMNNCPLSNIKNLGVILDSEMSWIQHIAYVKNKVAKGIGIMFKARTYLDRRSLINLYPYLIYCVESWGNAAKCHLGQLYIYFAKKMLGLLFFLIIIKLHMCIQNIYLENSRSYNYIILYKTESVS